MSTKRIAIDNLKTLFELRKTKPTRNRICVGRVFFINGVMGLSDASAVLFPVFYKLDPSPQQGDLIRFESYIEYLDNDSKSSKYNDQNSIFIISNILELVPCLEPWANAVIPSPIPNFSSQEIPNKQTTTQIYTHHDTHKRVQNIKTRNLAIERTKLFFNNRGFLSIEGPTLVPSGGGGSLFKYIFY